MAPQTSIPISANVLGTIGTVFWCIQLIPQIWYNWKQKKTDGLPGLMMFIWAVSAVPFGVYAIVQVRLTCRSSRPNDHKTRAMSLRMSQLLDEILSLTSGPHRTSTSPSKSNRKLSAAWLSSAGHKS